ncbi:MAG: hypothetical protein P8Z37_13170 [Acidobacteriota bacterium]
MKKGTAIGMLVLMMSSLCLAADNTVTGELIIDPPTLMALGFAWPIEGDDNREARVTIEYRRKGDSAWLRGLDLLRLQNEETFLRGSLDYTAPNMFAGSLFDLKENTDYEVRLRIEDPDGVNGDVEKTVVV